MRKAIAVALLTLMPSFAAAEMPLSIGAGSTGYGATTVDKAQHFTDYWAGLRGYTASEKTAVYVTYQHVGVNGGISGDGVKALLVSGSESIPWLYLMTDVGVAFSLAQQSNGSTTSAFTAGGGVAVAATEHISPFLYLSTYDSGPRFAWSVHIGLAVTDIQKMVTKGK